MLHVSLPSNKISEIIISRNRHHELIVVMERRQVGIVRYLKRILKGSLIVLKHLILNGLGTSKEEVFLMDLI